MSVLKRGSAAWAKPLNNVFLRLHNKETLQNQHSCFVYSRVPEESSSFQPRSYWGYDVCEMSFTMPATMNDCETHFAFATQQECGQVSELVKLP